MPDDLRTRIAAAIDRKYTEEAIGHTYEVCLLAADAVIRELPELHQPVSMSDYAAHLCQSGCDCSCCYGMDGCYHVTDPCNCGQAAKDHRHD